MAKFKGKGVVIAGLVAGAASFLSKKENRDKVQEYLNVAKDKVNENGGVQGLMQKAQSKVSGEKATTNPTSESVSDVAAAGQQDYVEETLEDVATAAADKADTALEGNHMLDEGGGQTAIDHYNEQQEKRY